MTANIMEVDSDSDSSPLLLRVERRDSINVDRDVVNVSGGYGRQASVEGCSSETEHHELHETRWQHNYHEAAIYLQEGASNDKFSTHPHCETQLSSYVWTHNTVYRLLDLLPALLLLALAFVEHPAVPQCRLPLWVHGCIELFSLVLIALALMLKMKWLGPRAYVRHIRTMLKTAMLLIMVSEVIAVLIRQTAHIRVTRAARPLFLLDSYYCRDTRRFTRQIIQSLPPILDVLLLLFFFMLIFAILGFYIFADVPGDENFQTIQQSFISLFVLMTTANFPDVMMPAFNYSRYSAIFFIAYLAIELYFLMNLFLAVVYDAFSKIEKGKLKKLLLHKHAACGLCFRLLVSKQNSSGISLRHFCGMMKYYKRHMNKRNVYLAFKILNSSKSGHLSLTEFYLFYDIINLRWQRRNLDELWSVNFRPPFNTICKALHRLVKYKWFEYFIYSVILGNFVWLLTNTIQISVANARDHYKESSMVANEYHYIWVSIAFVIFYIVEMLIKILGLGPHRYFTSGWNIFDFIVILLTAVGMLMELININFYYLLVVRPIRLLRLFKMKRMFRDIFGTLFMLISRMISICIVMLLLYYTFSIIGMELFARYDMRNSCVNGSVEVFYHYDNDSGMGSGYYYLNNFDNILSSSVTLFELTVVNNWHIIMEGYACVSSVWSRIYFMSFYLITMVVMTIMVAFILEAFLFRIQYRQKMKGHDMDDDAIMRVDVALTPEEYQMCQSVATPLTSFYIQQSVTSTQPVEVGLKWFRGERPHNKDDFSLRMYQDEVQEWMGEESVSIEQPQTE